MWEAREGGLLQGKLGRLLLGNYEGHKESVWLQRGQTAMIAGILSGMLSVFLRLPGLVSDGLFGTGFLVAIVCFSLAFGHLFRWIGYASGFKPVVGDERVGAVPPDQALDERGSNDSQSDDHGTT